ncbi:unnamed protein product [Penicillium salamii]|uniref:Chromatin SPT2 n=1 Tax=Penicillium salamii TaxID=1612424 RepID=A0A9W4NGK6_9EURO|nr:unnamed protein product [Penicillium salamii]CAG8376345.1 unnamed protein product [Penicillium salamii]CAG8378452.1 unnamed protein product [Penicillium salamii]CAG8412123.1 unnamed protein product [Penicillium salamii]
MSFLDSILSSIQTGKPSQPPLSQAPASPVPAAVPKKEERKPPVVRQVPPTSGNVGGTKRKAEDPLPHPSKPETKMPTRPVVAKSLAPVKPTVSPAPRAVPRPVSNTNSRPVPSKPALSKPPSKSNASSATKAAPPSKVAAKPAPAAAPVPSKPPPKGSFAAIMAQAKAAQDKAPVQVGMFKHQAGPKERLSKVERKRRQEEELAKEKEARSGKKPAPGSGGSAKDKIGRKRDTEGPSYKGTAKPTQTPEPPSYRGTAGLPSNRGSHDRRHQSRNSRQNEYLGTDEEDEGDYGGYGGYDDYYSDASSDMEAGMDDVDREEAAALKYAKREDEEELRQEMAAKKEKLERQRKLAALASRKR